jgi:flagellar biosynthesis anti-sigma factor FlgM
MRIDPNQTAQALNASERSGQQGPAASASPAAAGGVTGGVTGSDVGSVFGGIFGEDQADLSGGHVQAQAQVQALAAQALQFPEVRQEKVNALRQLALNGGYQPSPNQTAGAIFSYMLATPAA